MTPSKQPKPEKDIISNFVEEIRQDLYERLLELSKSSNSDRRFDNKDSIIDYIDDLIEHSKLISKEQANVCERDDCMKPLATKLCIHHLVEFSNNAKQQERERIKNDIILARQCMTFACCIPPCYNKKCLNEICPRHFSHEKQKIQSSEEKK